MPATTLKELIALSRSRPKEMLFASTGNGSANHLGGEVLNVVAGLKNVHVAYKGAGPALTDLVGCQVQTMFTGISSTLPYVKAGKLKAVAVTGQARLQLLPQVPTFSEAGVSGVDVKNWFGILAPAGTRKSVIDKFSAELARILAMPDTREKLIGQGVEPFINTPEQFSALMKAEIVSYARVVKSANIKLEN